MSSMMVDDVLNFWFAFDATVASRFATLHAAAAAGECDPMALALGQEAVAAGHDATLRQTERTFLYMPFMHSESRLIHVQAERLFAALGAPENHDFELKHKAIVDRFGRYPHPNAQRRSNHDLPRQLPLRQGGV